MGRIAPEQVIEFYRVHPVDLFVSTTSYEGRPVSMMEALSCGIPVASTAAGGVAELIGADRGWILPRESTPKQVVDLLESIVDRGSLDVWRKSARRHWEAQLRADKNFDQFATSLRSLGEGS
jgi:glycosyltransferase involved in cell wall biosynthesis